MIGEVKCSKHYKGTVFLTSMDLRLFPFDCQNLQVTFECLFLNSRKMISNFVDIYVFCILANHDLNFPVHFCFFVPFQICFKPYKKPIEEVSTYCKLA